MKLLKRMLNVLEGLVFILVSLCFQSILCFLFSMAVLAGLQALGLEARNRALEWIVFGLLLAAFNGLACWEYFKKGRAQVRLGQGASAIFMVPRALDLIWNGSERISK